MIVAKHQMSDDESVLTRKMWYTDAHLLAETYQCVPCNAYTSFYTY